MHLVKLAVYKTFMAVVYVPAVVTMSLQLDAFNAIVDKLNRANEHLYHKLKLDPTDIKPGLYTDLIIDKK